MSVRGSSFRRKAFKIALSVFLAFHFFCISLVPSGQNYAVYLVAPIVEPYVKLLSIGSTWSFFAPDPGPPPLYIEYELLSADGTHLDQKRWPDDQNAPFFREQRAWRATLARGLIALPTGGEQFMGPYLCRINSGAFSIRMWTLEFGAPSLLDVRDGKRRVGDEVDQRRRFVGTVSCSDFDLNRSVSQQSPATLGVDS
jgi:hypothetical protein